MSNNIGETAGKVWDQLNSNGPMTVAKLKTALKADVFTLNAAIGWLAREDKIELGKVRNSVTVTLK
ncbi:MAG: hypothetical protein D8M58_11370 [Calditrichaeota bacterium]|nr:MAG: hypothetical protein DWQ03_10745 [Calditrichota bacterium]MBL1205993.1 hypothetical protein [Calditrichota bacterium]NOG45821.1 winged helix-turn-helix domain-containing protein [Calditrichota bacterium]